MKMYTFKVLHSATFLSLKNISSKYMSQAANLRICIRHFHDSKQKQPKNEITTTELLNFSDHETAFRSKSTSELWRACTILTVCSKDKIVDNALTLLRGGERWLGPKIFGAIMRRSLYAQFVAGETGPAVVQTARSLRKQGLHLMVAPALEADVGDAMHSGDGISMYDRNCKELLKLAELTGLVKRDSKSMHPPFLQLKMTAVVPMDILVKITETIKQKYLEDQECKGYVTLVEELARVMETTEMQDQTKSLSKMLNLTKKQAEELQLSCARLREIGNAATKQEIRLTVDMEWTYINPMCSALASALMAVFNRKSPNVCSTVQCYLKSAMGTLSREERIAHLLGVCYGAKLVRGAYLERERQVAPSEVCSSYQETSNNYDAIMKKGVEKAIKADDGRHFLIIATHNEAAVRSAMHFLKLHDADRSPNVAFAQIYGMAEHVSLPLAQNGFSVYKSVAFGSLSQVLPYLARRAAENRAVMRGARRERQLLQNEIARRIRAKLHV